MSESNKVGKSRDVLSEMVDQDVEQPGDTPSDVPPNAAEADKIRMSPKAPD